MKEYLAYFGSKNHEFRVPELRSVAQCLGYEFWAEELTSSEHFHCPFVKIRLPSDEAVVKLCERSVSLYGIFEVWGEGEDHAKCGEEVKAYMEKHEEAHRRVKERSFKFTVQGFNRHYSREAQLELIHTYSWMNFGGKCEMKNPEEMYWIMELVRQHAPDEEKPRKVFFVRQIALGARPLIDNYTLKRRSYLGTTSMESEISFFTANQALARPGSLIFDPFVGTGSLLVTCSALGAYTLGADIDMDVLIGKQKNKNIRSNFKQYNLEHLLLDLIRFDNAKHSVIRTHRPFLDGIVCDPPYGIRAGAKKVGVRAHTIVKHEKTGTPHVPIHTNPADPGWLPHIPQCVPYSVSDVLLDLLDFSARSLVLGGRLVYWLPTTSEYKDSDLPLHPCFNIVGNSEQKLTLYFSRRLITMEKIKEFDPNDVGTVPEQPIEAFDQSLQQGKSNASASGDEESASSSAEPAHANLAAKVTRQASRYDSRNESDVVPENLTRINRITGAELKRQRKQERKAARKAAEALAAQGASAPSNESASASSEAKASSEPPSSSS